MEEKLPSRTEDRWAKLGLLHFGRFGTQKTATRPPRVDHGKFGWVFAWPRERSWSTLGMFLGPWTLDYECFVEARCLFSNFRLFHAWVDILSIL